MYSLFDLIASAIVGALIAAVLMEMFRKAPDVEVHPLCQCPLVSKRFDDDHE